MIIRLSEIPEEGKEFHWSSETGEANQVLEDLIKKQKYSAEFTIRPINSKDFELVGKISTTVPDLCSRCGIDFTFPVSTRFQEILIPPQKEDRSGKYAKVNHVSESVEDGPTSSEYGRQMTFNMAEYLHEVVALCLPFNPAPPLDAKEKCTDCGKGPQDWVYGDIAPLEDEVKVNPFSALKNLKLQ